MAIDDRLIRLTGGEASVLAYLAIYREHEDVRRKYLWLSEDFSPEARDIAEFMLGYHGAYRPAVVSTGLAIMDWADNGRNGYEGSRSSGSRHRSSHARS